MLRVLSNVVMPSVVRRLEREIQSEEHARLDAIRNLEYAGAQLSLCETRLSRARSMLSELKAQKEKNPP